MEPIEKTKLIESLYKVLMTLGVLSADYAKVIISPYVNSKLAAYNENQL